MGLGVSKIGLLSGSPILWVGFKPSKVKIHDTLGLPHFILEPPFSDRIWQLFREKVLFFFTWEFGAYFHTKSRCWDLKQCHPVTIKTRGFDLIDKNWIAFRFDYQT